jgi:hypothetical protein
MLEKPAYHWGISIVQKQRLHAKLVIIDKDVILGRIIEKVCNFGGFYKALVLPSLWNGIFEFRGNGFSTCIMVVGGGSQKWRHLRGHLYTAQWAPVGWR